MPLDRHDAAHVWDMLRHAKLVSEMTDGRDQGDMESDPQFRLAIERAIEIIG